MTDLDSIPGLFDPTPATNAGDTRRKCRHPKDARIPIDTDEGRAWTCGRCGHSTSAARIRAGRAVGKRGRKHERQSMERLGLVNVGGLNRERDGGDRLDPFVAQSKSFVPKRFPGWMLAEIDKLRRVGLLPHQTPVLVITESRQGVKRRGIVVLDMEDWIGLHGPTPESAE
jgi:hypothetical protein